MGELSEGGGGEEDKTIHHSWTATVSPCCKSSHCSRHTHLRALNRQLNKPRPSGQPLGAAQLCLKLSGSAARPPISVKFKRDAQTPFQSQVTQQGGVRGGGPQIKQDHCSTEQTEAPGDNYY